MAQSLALLGDYEKDQRASINRGRYLFLKAVEKCEPQVRTDLIDGEPRQLFRRIPDDAALDLKWPDLGENRGTAALGDALVQWARRWHLEDNWCIEQALHLLQMAAFPPTEIDTAGDGEEVVVVDPDWSVQVSLATITTDEEMHFTFEHRGGDLAIQTRAEIKEDIRKAFNRKVRSYLDRMRQIAADRGYKPVIKKSKLSHFEMLARYQVQGWTYEGIAREYGLGDPVSVGHIIPPTARLIGLTLRPGQGKRGPDRPGGRARRRR